MEIDHSKINIADLKKIIRILLSELNKFDEQIVISPDKNLYWNISDKELYDVYKDPKELTLGSLTADWEFLSKMMINNREMISHDFYKLASIFRVLGNEEILAGKKLKR